MDRITCKFIIHDKEVTILYVKKIIFNKMKNKMKRKMIIFDSSGYNLWCDNDIKINTSNNSFEFLELYGLISDDS